MIVYIYIDIDVYYIYKYILYTPHIYIYTCDCSSWKKQKDHETIGFTGEASTRSAFDSWGDTGDSFTNRWWEYMETYIHRNIHRINLNKPDSFEIIMYPRLIKCIFKLFICHGLCKADLGKVKGTFHLGSAKERVCRIHGLLDAVKWWWLKNTVIDGIFTHLN